MICVIDEARTLTDLYAAFNARDLDALLPALADDVDWPNAWRLLRKVRVRCAGSAVGVPAEARGGANGGGRSSGRRGGGGVPPELEQVAGGGDQAPFGARGGSAAT